MRPEIDTTEIAKELGERLREELDYAREAKHAALFRLMLKGEGNVRVPETWPELSTDRLLTMRWLDGKKLLAYVGHDLADRNAIAKALFTAWWKPFATYGVIHGDPHLGNYTVFEKSGHEAGIDRLLTMSWLDGTKLLAYVDHDLSDRNAIAKALFTAWWKPFATYGVIHGDPHLGNYTVFEEEEHPEGGGGTAKQEARSAEGATGKQKKEAGRRPAGINLLDFGCVRIFPPAFVAGVINLYHALRADDRDGIAAAYRSWGFRDIDDETVDTLTLWARFIYGPLMDDRVRTIAGDVAPHAYGRREAWEVKQRLKPKKAITVPREFVFLERAAIGLGAVMLHLKAELNFHQLFEAAIADFDVDALAKRQAKALKQVGL